MPVSIVATPITGSISNFYRNSPFDISFSIANVLGNFDTSLYFGNSTGTPISGVRLYVSNGHFKSPTTTTGIPTIGSLGTLSVDAMTTTPTLVSTATPQTYVSANVGCTDPSGNVYFAVANQNKVFRLDVSGAVTTFAGTGALGDADGDRLVAQFRAPASIATDGSGTFFVTDQYRVRKIDSNGTVSTLAGTSSRGTADGTGSNASFVSASTVVIRPNGDLLVSDDDSHCIRNVTQAGVVTTYAGLAGQSGFADDQLRPDSNILVFQGAQAWPYNTSFFSAYETSNGGVSWEVTPFPPSPPMTTIQAAIDASTEILYVGSMSPHTGFPFVFVAKNEGTYRGPVSFPSGALASANGVATNGAGTYVLGGRVPAVDVQVLRSVDNGSNWVTTGPLLGLCRAVGYGGGTWMAAGDSPSASTSNLIYSTDASTWTATSACPISNIYGLAYGGGRWVAVGTGGSTVAFSDNNGVSWTGSTPIAARGNKIAYNAGVWVAGFEEYTLNALYYSTDGATFTGTDNGDSGQVTAVYYSEFESRWFASVGTQTLVSFDGSQWSTLTSPVAASINAYIDVSYSLTQYSSNGARFAFPHGLLYDPQGNLYIADQYNDRIRRVAAGSSNVTTYAGSGSGTISNGTLTTAGMARPSSLAQDSTGTIYVGSAERNTLQTIVGSNVTLLAGANLSPGYVDGVPSAARFNGLGGLAVDQNDVLYISEIYNGDLRKLVTYPEVRPGTDRPPGYTIIATSNYPIFVNSRIDVCWTSVGGSLPLYKYEPFCNSFTANGSGGATTDTLAYTATSSTELLGYLSGTGTSNVLFRGPNGASVAYPYTLTLEVQALSNGNVVDSVSTNVTISAGRIITTPCNSSLVFYRNEPSPNPVFSLVSSSAQLVYSATTLPAGLSFVKTASNAFTLTGTPTIQSITSNYTILAQDTSGRTYSTQVTMLVNPERLIIDVSGSLTLTGLTSNDPIAPITFTSRFPPYNNPSRAVTYSWFPAPPAGLQFKRKDGSNVLGLQATIAGTEDASFALTLSGTITSAQLLEYASNGVTSASLVFNGVRTNGGGLLSPAIPKTITFSFAEFINFSSNVPSLYVGRAVSNMFYSATTYFPVVDSSITSIEIIDGFIPDGLDASFTLATQRFSFVGTPTSAGSYGFTLQATNGQGLSVTLPVTMTPSNDSVVITTTADSCFNFIQYRPLTSAKTGFYTSSIRYTATAASGSIVNVVGANLPTGVTLVSISNGVYELQGVPTAASTLTTATLTGTAQGTGAVGLKTFLYSVSAEVFTFNDLSLTFSQNIPITPVTVVATTLSEQPIIRYSAPALPPALQIANTGKLTGTPLGDTSGTFDVTAYTSYSSGTKTYSYSMSPDQVLLRPFVAQTITAPGCNVSIPIAGYSLSGTTVSNFRFQDPFLYGLTVNPTTGLLSGTLSSTLPTVTTFTVLANAGSAVGSLNGQMLTYNQTEYRVNMLVIRDQSTLQVYAGAVSTLGLAPPPIFESSNRTAARIGINGAGTYLIPTSSDTVLRSTTGLGYSSVSLGQSAQTPLMTGLVYDAASSTWWIGGTLLAGTRSVYVFKSTDDGLTWNSGTLIPGLQDRSGNASPGSGVYNAYLYGGVDLASRDGILLVGGQQIARSSTGGTVWTTPTSSLIEVARFSLEQGTVWLAVGSSLYSSTTTNTYTADATTIVYSLDQGQTWNNAPGGFNMNAYEVVYGNGVWLASGLDWTGTAFVGRIRYSFDGLTWAILTSIPDHTYASTADVYPLGIYGAIAYDQSTWTVALEPADFTQYIYTHPDGTPIDSGWTLQTTGEAIPPATRRFSSIVGQTIDPGLDLTYIQFPSVVGGPTFISPAQSTYVAWQYMPLPSITFAATGTYPISYFVSSLPVGLTWDPATRTVTGSAVQTGTQTFTVYALEDKPGDDAVTSFTVTLFVEVPRIVKQQTGAGAYTSLLRQYTTVNAAQNARDTRAFPTQVSGIGEFASPYPPDVITPSNCPC